MLFRAWAKAIPLGVITFILLTGSFGLVYILDEGGFTRFQFTMLLIVYLIIWVLAALLPSIRKLSQSPYIGENILTGLFIVSGPLGLIIVTGWVAHVLVSPQMRPVVRTTFGSAALLSLTIPFWFGNLIQIPEKKSKKEEEN